MALLVLLALITFGVTRNEDLFLIGVSKEQHEEVEIIDFESDSMDISIDEEAAPGESEPVDLSFAENNEVVDVHVPNLASAVTRHPLFPSPDTLLTPVGGDGGKQAGNQTQGSATGGNGRGDGAPAHAVRKGSFAAWTEPKDPVPGRTYNIIVQVTLPEGVKKYSKEDLSGRVIGTDGYVQSIPSPSGGRQLSDKEIERMIDAGMVWIGGGIRTGGGQAVTTPVQKAQLKRMLKAGMVQMRGTPSDQFEFRDGHARITVQVPGAQRLVKDRIEVQSKLLNERQVLDIEF